MPQNKFSYGKFGVFLNNAYFCSMNARKKKERITDAEWKDFYKEASKFVLDIAKLVFAGVILGSIMDLEFDRTTLILIGGFVLLILISSGIYLYYLAIKKF